ncbi:HDOD domain-containing protein [Undibacterium rugosum]|uniref:HDOD domain-containing protein n=1 Tax=Undibacterium rugosum TaxID=2762291 RepID=UPI001B82EC07|nr:HDOD domain-containing protein [Undibacterium rugosum]MBR7776923.1 HDOD domain-containing protein [Undibacterium rugosum]
MEKNAEFTFLEDFTAELSAKKLVFPTSLGATMKIRKALSQPDISNDQVARIIGAEPVLSAKVLHLSNTASFNPSGRQVTDLRSATLLLGFAAVRNIAISIGMKQLAENKYKGGFSVQMDGLWRRSLRVAALAMVVARNKTRMSPDKAMLSGLLHDIGKFYILNRAHHYQHIFTSEALLWNLIDDWNASIGAAILEDWEVPDEIRDAVVNFKHYQAAPQHKISLTDVLTTADFLDAVFVHNQPEQLDWSQVPASLQRLHIDAENLPALMLETKTELSIVLHAIQ